MPYLEANQPKFHDLESGDGPVALFVHGGPFDATMSSKQLDGPAAAADALATDVVESLERAPIGDRSQMTFPDTDRIVPYLRGAIFPALAASRRAARATAPQVTFADTDRIVPYLRSL